MGLEPINLMTALQYLKISSLSRAWIGSWEGGLQGIPDSFEGSSCHQVERQDRIGKYMRYILREVPMDLV